MKDARLGNKASKRGQGTPWQAKTQSTVQASMLARGVEHFGGMVTSAIEETEQGQLPSRAVQDTESKQSTEHKAHSTEPM